MNIGETCTMEPTDFQKSKPYTLAPMQWHNEYTKFERNDKGLAGYFSPIRFLRWCLTLWIKPAQSERSSDL